MATPDRVDPTTASENEQSAHAELVAGLLRQAGLAAEVVKNDRTAFAFSQMSEDTPVATLWSRVASVLSELEEDGLVTLRPGILVEIVN